MELFDRRIKMCITPGCKNAKHHRKFKPEDKYCPLCGNELSFVCARCGVQIEDEGKNVRLCYRCQAKAEDEKENRIAVAKKTAAAVGAGAVAVLAVGPKVLKGIKDII